MLRPPNSLLRSISLFEIDAGRVLSLQASLRIVTRMHREWRDRFPGVFIEDDAQDCCEFALCLQEKFSNRWRVAT